MKIKILYLLANMTIFYLLLLFDGGCKSFLILYVDKIYKGYEDVVFKVRVFKSSKYEINKRNVNFNELLLPIWNESNLWF